MTKRSTPSALAARRTANPLHQIFAEQVNDTRQICAEIYDINSHPCDDVRPQIERLAEAAEVVEENALLRLRTLLDELAGATRRSLKTKLPAPLGKKPWKRDRLLQADIKMERELAHDRPRWPRRRAHPKQAMMLDTDVFAGKVASSEAGAKPRVVLPRERYEELLARASHEAAPSAVPTPAPGLAPPPAAATPAATPGATVAAVEASAVAWAAARSGAASSGGPALAAEDSRIPVPAHAPQKPSAEKAAAALAAAAAAAAPEARAPPEEREPEEVSILLSRRAQEEAELCLRPDGTLDALRLRAAIAGGSKRFSKLLFGRLPYTSLKQLAAGSPGKALGVPEATARELLLGDVMNSALLAEAARERKAWNRRPLPSEGAAGAPPQPPQTGASVGLRPMFSATSGKSVKIRTRALDEEEARHPRIEPARAGPLPLVPDLQTFRVLLSLFSGGVLDGFPWGCQGVLLGGSAVGACLFPAASLSTYGPCLRAAAALRQVKAIRHALAAALHRRPGSERAAALVLEYTGGAEEAMDALKPLKSELFHNEGGHAPYNTADIDLFFTAPTKAAAAETLAKVQRELQASIQAAAKKLRTRAGGEPRETGPACVAVRTPNALTLCPEFPLRHVQLVLRIGEDMAEHIASADLDCTATCYDGSNVWAAPRAIRAFETGYNLVSNRMFCQRRDACERVAKYSHRGFGSMVYELCRHEPRCDVELDGQTEGKLKQAKGLASRTKRGFASARGAKRDATEHDVAVELMSGGYDHLHLPRGPGVTPAAVAALLECRRKDELVFKLPEDVPWGELAEWRRERRPQPLGGDDADPKGGSSKGSGPCYCCGSHCPEEPGSPAKPLEPAAGPAEADVPPPPATAGAASGEPRGKRLQVVPLCRCCRDENDARKRQAEDLAGYTAVVTGGRCKIGFEAVLRLLRCGAHVVASTRFPRSAAERFLQEPDSSSWAERLHVYGADFTHLGLLQAFIAQVAKYYSVDILVNNAAQTIRRPPAYYSKLFEREHELHAKAERPSGLVKALGEDPWLPHGGSGSSPPLALAPVATGGCAASAVAEVVRTGLGWTPAEGLASVPALLSSALALVPRTSPDSSAQADSSELFPARKDLHGEQLDLRSSHSWTATLCAGGGVEGRELLEVLAVNAAAPFMLFQGLLPSLRRPRGADGCGNNAAAAGRFVVNVTSAEGSFSIEGSAAKTFEHPHTNMAKAALNMLTKTSASELAQYGVYCTAVDPGWVSMMRPGEPAAPGRPLPPLDAADGAARVLAPVLDGLRALREGRAPPHGVLLRNFVAAPW